VAYPAGFGARRSRACSLDVARTLTLNPSELTSTDITDRALEALRSNMIREMVVPDRSGPLQAEYSTPEFLGLGHLPRRRRGRPALDAAGMAIAKDPGIEPALKRKMHLAHEYSLEPHRMETGGSLSAPSFLPQNCAVTNMSNRWRSSATRWTPIGTQSRPVRPRASARHWCCGLTGTGVSPSWTSYSTTIAASSAPTEQIQGNRREAARGFRSRHPHHRGPTEPH